MIFHEWIRKARELGASDLHVEAEGPLIARVRGKLQPLGETASAVDLERTSKDLLGADGWGGFLSRGSADISVEVAGTRCRINLVTTTRGIALAVPLFAPSIKDLTSCNLRASLRRLPEPPSRPAVTAG